ncbi:MAG: hypothetical protein MZW92_71980 [Comamonadaceae bacterium]|nr:hypothetical protein [Comamonadaceae bacterium]
MKRILYISILIVFGAFVAFTLTKPVNKAAKDDNPYRLFKTFAEVYNIIRARYVEPVSTQRLMEGAFRGGGGKLQRTEQLHPRRDDVPAQAPH